MSGELGDPPARMRAMSRHRRGPSRSPPTSWRRLATSGPDRRVPVPDTLAGAAPDPRVVEAIRDLPCDRRSRCGRRSRTFDRTRCSPSTWSPSPILRAGLGLLDARDRAATRIAVGLHRAWSATRRRTSRSRYYAKLPPVEGRHVLVLDPMLATGGFRFGRDAPPCKRRAPESITFVCVVAAPEGSRRWRPTTRTCRSSPRRTRPPAERARVHRAGPRRLRGTGCTGPE